MANRNQLRAYATRYLGHGIAAMLLGQEKSNCARLAENVRKLLGLVGRVDRNEGEPRPRCSKLDECPFGNIRRPDRDALTRFEVGAERQREFSDMVRERAEAPSPADLAL